MENVHVRQLMTPLLILGILIALITLVTKRLYLPDLRDTTAGEGEKLERGIWSFRHLTLGVIAIFFYVGAEVSVGINVNLHALELGNSDSPLLFLGSSNLVVWGVDLGHSRPAGLPVLGRPDGGAYCFRLAEPYFPPRPIDGGYLRGGPPDAGCHLHP